MGEMTRVSDRKKRIMDLVRQPGIAQQFAAALPRVGITPERFTRMILTCLNKNPSLYKCSEQSLLGCFVQAAESGLSPSGIGGEAYIIPYGDTATFIPGYRGLMKAAWRSDRVLELSAECVLTGDEFSYSKGTESHLRHTPKDEVEEEEANITHAYAYAKLTGGGFQFVVMTKRAIDKIRKGSRASRNGPWVTHYPEMAKKTAIRRLMKMLPLSSDDMRLVELAAQEEGGLAQDLPVVDVPAEVTDTPEPPADDAPEQRWGPPPEDGGDLPFE